MREQTVNYLEVAPDRALREVEEILTREAAHIAMEQCDVSVDTEQEPADAARLLTEVDRLFRSIGPDRTMPATVLDATFMNLSTLAKEHIPHAVSTVEHTWDGQQFWWGRETCIQSAKSGGNYYRTPQAFLRLEHEVAEARYVDQLRDPDQCQVFVSPKMTANDAPEEVAALDNLHRDDMLRIHWVEVDERGAPRRKFMQALLVTDIPLSSWKAWLKDEGNIFGKSIDVDGEDSALSVMKIFRELSLPREKLPEGVVSLVESVLPFVPADKQASVQKQLDLFRSDQEDLHRKVEVVATRWLHFETELAFSLLDKQATPAIVQFIESLKTSWTDADQALFRAHEMPGGDWRMSRSLAARIEEARKNIFLSAASLVTGCEEVIGQADDEAVHKIITNEMLIQQMLQNGASLQEVARVEAGNNNLIARQNFKIKGGCPGDSDGKFRKDEPKGDRSGTSEEDGAASRERGKCYVKVNCPHCSHLKDNGAPRSKEKILAHYDEQKWIHCDRCYAFASPDGKHTFDGIIAPRGKKFQQTQALDETPKARTSAETGTAASVTSSGREDLVLAA